MHYLFPFNFILLVFFVVDQFTQVSAIKHNFDCCVALVKEVHRVSFAQKDYLPKGRENEVLFLLFMDNTTTVRVNNDIQELVNECSNV